METFLTFVAVCFCIYVIAISAESNAKKNSPQLQEAYKREQDEKNRK